MLTNGDYLPSGEIPKRGSEMSTNEMLVVFITLVVASVFLFVWKRRDAGIVPEDRLPEALHEPLNGKQHG
jgi:hypothetical protein